MTRRAPTILILCVLVAILAAAIAWQANFFSIAKKKDVWPADPKPPHELLKRPIFIYHIFGRKRVYRNGLINANLGNYKTEKATLGGLRWLKAVQNEDGSWGTPTNALKLTGLATLTYLYHGEMPEDSPEFGETTRMALEFLIRELNREEILSSGDADLAIATTALSEFCGQFWNPNVRSAAENGLRPIVKRQVSLDELSFPTGTSLSNRLVVAGWNLIALETGLKAKLIADSGELLHARDGAKAQFNALSNIVQQIPPLWCGVAPDNATSFSRYSKDMKASAWNDEFGPQLLFLMTMKALGKGWDYWRIWFDKLWPSLVCAQFTTPPGEPGVKCGCPVCGSGVLGNRLTNPYKRDDGKSFEIGHWIGHDVAPDSVISDTCLAILELTMARHKYHVSSDFVDVPLPDLSATNDVEVDFGI